jgi:serine/threonine-protein kinase
MSAPTFIGTSFREYRLVEFIGAGGMGEVYRAVHARTGHTVAVKVLKQSVNQTKLTARFFEEACLLSSLHHPHIVAMEAFGEIETHPCIAMEYVGGPTLETLLRERGALPVATALPLFSAVIEAVAYIHRRGIVHRDLKASNVKLTTDGLIKLLDFGIARGATSPELTAVGSVVGTWQRLAPEQIDLGEADTRSDLWALGILLYELLTGQLPFDAPTFGELHRQITRAQYTPPSALVTDVPREIEAIIARCLKRRPAERYQTAEELWQDVRRYNEASSLTRKAQQLWRQALRSLAGVQRRWWAVFGAAGCLLVMGLWFLVEKDVQPVPLLPAPAVMTSASGSSDAGVPIDIQVLEGRAEVLINDQPHGMTPLQYRAQAGETFALTLRQAGYREHREKITVGSTAKAFSFWMEKEPSSSAAQEAR